MGTPATLGFINKFLQVVGDQILCDRHLTYCISNV